ncbi:MAG: TetR family transcriptional regulator [Anaerolineae bacterium]
MLVSAHLKERLESLPDKPGVYLLKDTSGRIIYIGRAASLRSHMESAINPQMAAQVADVEYVLTDTDTDAHKLEQSLIQCHHPKFNLGWKERIKAERADEILEAAARAFAQKGYERATIKEIAAAAEVAEGTIYNYFQSKRDILISILERLITESMRQVLEYAPEDMESDPKNFLRTILRDRLELISRNQELMRAIFTEFHQDSNLRQQFFREIILPLVSRFEMLLEMYSRAEACRPLNPVAVTRAIMGLFLVFHLLVSTGVDEQLASIPPEELADEWAELFLHGLLNTSQEA